MVLETTLVQFLSILVSSTLFYTGFFTNPFYLDGRGKNEPLYLTSKLAIMQTANLACELVFTKVFEKNLFWFDCLIYTVIFSKMTSFLEWRQKRFKFGA